MWFVPVANTKSNSRLNGLKKRRRKPPFLCNIVKFLHIFVIYKHNQNIMSMNHKPGQILWIKSSEGPWYYISVLSCMIPVEHMDETYELHTCCDLCVDTDGDCLTFKRGNGSLLDVSVLFEEVREATDVEREYLYKALVKAFKDYDLSWANHFTDSSYFDILDWLAWEFNVDLDDEANTDTPLGEAMSEIQNYIWDALCKETGNYQEKTVEPEMVNKQEFIENVVKYLEANFPDIENVGGWYKESFINNFRKTMEE